MAKRITVEAPYGKSYDIVIRADFHTLAQELGTLGKAEGRVCVVTDSHVEKLYAEAVLSELASLGRPVCVFAFPAGEAHKNLGTVQDVYRFLIEHGIDRKDTLLALGGGVVGDLTGYAAATYLRGIDFIQIPTTLLSQVDSSIGGKTGVDLDQYKNMVGAFHMPRLVYMNLSVLETLDARQYASGMAEIVKHGLIRDAAYYERLIERAAQIMEKDPAAVEEMVYESCLIKKAVVEKDPTEKGERALLNFGHTLGHAIEKYGNFTMLHGECVSLGCVAAAYISCERGLLSQEAYHKIKETFRSFGLPTSLQDIDVEEVLRFTKSDKKMEQGKIKFILLRELGEAFIDRTVSDAEMSAALKALLSQKEESL